VEVAFILCDAAQVSPDGKVHILGAGWRLCGPVLAPHAVVAIVTMESHEQGIEHEFLLELVDADGRAVTVPTPQGPMTIRAEGQIGAESGPEAPDGAVADIPFVVPVGPGLPLQPGATYVWQLWLDGNTREDWRCTFYVRAAPPDV
jgi:hypothetical protein